MNDAMHVFSTEVRIYREFINLTNQAVALEEDGADPRALKPTLVEAMSQCRHRIADLLYVWRPCGPPH